MFFCLGLALVVDGARRAAGARIQRAEVLPRWSGDTLDLVVDFTTYVFVPAYAIAASGLLPQVSGDSGRHRRRDQRRALFRRPRNEDERQLFPWLSGRVESGGVLSLSAGAAGVGSRRWRLPFSRR